MTDVIDTDLTATAEYRLGDALEQRDGFCSLYSLEAVMSTTPADIAAIVALGNLDGAEAQAAISTLAEKTAQNVDQARALVNKALKDEQGLNPSQIRRAFSDNRRQSEMIAIAALGDLTSGPVKAAISDLAYNIAHPPVEDEDALIENMGCQGSC